MEYERYALYYAPLQQSALAEFGNSWLGWNPETRQEIERPAQVKIQRSEIEIMTQIPSRYGFHGTLKPPFRLKQGRTFKQLEASVEELATRLSFIICDPLQLTQIGHFLALVPSNCHKILSRFAGKCVKELDDFRAPATEQELMRRRKAELTPHQEELLMSWGYPYVMDEFRFHLTLTGQLEKEQIQTTRRALQNAMSQVSSAAFRLNEICLFGDPGNGQPFHLIRRFSL